MEKPLIQLVRTPNRGYCYDAVMGQILPVGDESFTYLSQLMCGQNVGTPPDEINQLQQAGYLATVSPVKVIQHPYTKYLPLFLSRKLDHITLQVTQNCNFRCKYCVYSEENKNGNRSHSPKRMSWDTAKGAIDFLWEQSIDSNNISISFYGGEPLIEFPLICRAMEYAKQKFYGKTLRFNITSNGSLLTDEIIHYFAANNVSLMISLDGPKAINDKNRVFAGGKGTFDTVMEKVERIKEIEPDYANEIRFSMVMDPSNDFDCINEIQIECNAINISSLTSTFVELPEEKAHSVSERFSNKYNYQLFLAWLAYLGRYPKDRISAITFQSLLNELSSVSKGFDFAALREIDCPSGPCVAGKLRLFCDVEGNLFPCERVSECSAVMRLGSIFTELDADAANKLTNVGQITEKKCKNCWAFRFCSLCAKKADNGSGILSPEERLKHCHDSYSAAMDAIKSQILVMELNEFYKQQLKQKRDGEYHEN